MGAAVVVGAGAGLVVGGAGVVVGAAGAVVVVGADAGGGVVPAAGGAVVLAGAAVVVGAPPCVDTGAAAVLEPPPPTAVVGLLPVPCVVRGWVGLTLVGRPIGCVDVALPGLLVASVAGAVVPVVAGFVVPPARAGVPGADVVAAVAVVVTPFVVPALADAWPFADVAAGAESGAPEMGLEDGWPGLPLAVADAAAALGTVELADDAPAVASTRGAAFSAKTAARAPVAVIEATASMPLAVESTRRALLRRRVASRDMRSSERR
ncbi:hypothetical protein acdb102_33220 [Acidothermaceae bacterium B102]|nr:hypothetical protein acdb102_33220 [Acidothermaceae bacterium B102]